MEAAAVLSEGEAGVDMLLTLPDAIKHGDKNSSGEKIMDEGMSNKICNYFQLEFESEEHAYQWYNRYAEGVGFNIRREYIRRNEAGVITNRRFTCNKEGYRTKDKRNTRVRKPRKETRTGCEARLTIALRSNNKYKVIDFEPLHNHEVFDASSAHILPSPRDIDYL